MLQKINKWFKVKVNEDKEEDESNILEYKILVVGERTVGKSSYCKKFTDNEFSLEIKSTTKNECYVKKIKIQEQIIKVYVIDIDVNVMCNDHSFLYSDLTAAICLYDISRIRSFERVDYWIADIRMNTKAKIPIMLVGHKTDLTYLRNIDYLEGLEKANNLNCLFVETSCVDPSSVREGFKMLIAKIYYNDFPEYKKNYFPSEEVPFELRLSNNTNNTFLSNNEQGVKEK